jgi:hypothetical protein
VFHDNIKSSIGTGTGINNISANTGSTDNQPSSAQHNLQLHNNQFTEPHHKSMPTKHKKNEDNKARMLDLICYG